MIEDTWTGREYGWDHLNRLVSVEFSDDQFNSVFWQYIHDPGIDEPLAFLSDKD